MVLQCRFSFIRLFFRGWKTISIFNNYFQHIIQKYNNTYKVQMTVITPHVCRHTYCSNMAKSGMNPKALQYLMGHSDISITLNTYTHVNLEDAREEIARLRIV
nr:site-specific integrase [Dorea longicatena]